MSEILITQQEQGSTFYARPDDVIVFHLEENITTGFGWEAEVGEGSVVELQESKYVEASGKEIGCGGMRVLCFVARSPGTQEIRLKLRRPWDPPDKSLQQIEVIIRVR